MAAPVDLVRELFKKYQLHYDASNPESRDNDVFVHKHYTIITRTGIDKIQAAEKITITHDVVYVSDQTVVLKARGFRQDAPDVVVETFASASSLTCKSGYFAEVAEKRANSRVVLKLVGLYKYGVYGQDEFDVDRPERRAVYKSEQTA